MKKAILIKALFVAFLVGTATVSHAQIRLGVRGGLNLATISGDEDSQNGILLGFHLGGMVHIPVSGRLCFQPEILFSQKGTQDKDESDLKLKLSYIDLPLMLNYRFEPGIYIEGGPTIGALIGAKAKYKGDSQDVKDNFSGADIGVGLGIGYRAAMGFSLGVRYQAGLSNINDSDKFTDHNNVIMLTLGYLFGEEHD